CRGRRHFASRCHALRRVHWVSPSSRIVRGEPYTAVFTLCASIAFARWLRRGPNGARRILSRSRPDREHIFDGSPEPIDGALRVNLSQAGLGLELKQNDVAKYRVA